MSEPSVLAALVSGVRAGSIEVVDLTAPLSSSTPVLRFPPGFGRTAVFAPEEISRYAEVEHLRAWEAANGPLPDGGRPLLQPPGVS